MNIQELVRKRFVLEGVQVTEENLQEVAAWCAGEVKSSPKGVSHVKVDATNPPSPRHTKAYIGDWVLRSAGTENHPGVTFKVYTTRSLENNFEMGGKDLLYITGVHHDDGKNILKG